MSLNTPTTSARLGYLAALAAATFATAGAVVVTDDSVAQQARTSQQAATRYFDIEANKAASIRALGHHLAQQRAISVTRYDDIEANKARSRRAR